jgi:hypothetical protein
MAGVAGGLVAAGSVNWYHVSSNEGESAYFIVEIVLLSAFLGFFAGLVISRYLDRFSLGLGTACGSILALAGAVAWIAWGLADIPPTINGHELKLVVEVRVPKGAERPPVLTEKQFVWFETGPRFGPARAREAGNLNTANARFEDGRWIVPGSVHIFTTRDSRTLVVALGDKLANGFELHFPGHPGPKYKQWSPWLPDAEVPKWPDSEMSYRFRIEEIIPVAKPLASDPFAALTADSPLREWLQFFDGFGRQPEKDQAIMKQVESRPADFAEVLRSGSDEDYRQALNVAYVLSASDPQMVKAMRDLAADFERQIQEFNAMAPQEPGSQELGAHIRDRFSRWCMVWATVQDKGPSDHEALVEEMLKAASVRADSPAMQAVVADARQLLAYLRQ